MKKLPVKYLRDAKLCGSLFEENLTSGAISSVFTDFHANYASHLRLFLFYKTCQQWVFDELLDGHELLTILPIQGPTIPVQGLTQQGVFR